MHDVRLIPYQKKFIYSYSFGVYPTIELLKFHPKSVIKILLNSKGKQNQGLRKIQELCQKLKIRVEWADGLIKKLSGSENTYAVGVFEKYIEKIEQGKNHLILVNPEDGGNLGTIMRTCLAFDLNNIGVIKPGVDCFDPKVIRASMGAEFSIRVEYYGDLETYRREHANTMYLFMTKGQTKLNEAKFEKPFALVFGSESSGLDEQYRKYGNSVQIEQNDQVDSLNLSIACGLALYKTRF